jgi:hypothetical protein
MLEFLITYLLLIISGSFFTLGWYVITRGYYFLNPDGTKEVAGEIFGFWERFFEDVKGYKKINYSGDQLIEKAAYLFQAKPSFRVKIMLVPENTSFTINTPLTAEERKVIEDITGTKTRDNGYLYLYNDYPEYRFPDWFRKPISGCYKCFASIYGSIIYFIINSMSGHIFDWASSPTATMWLMWPAYCISIAFLNTAIGSKYKLSQ